MLARQATTKGTDSTPHLAGSGCTDCAGPVVIHMCHLICQPLHVVRLETRVVAHYHIVGGSDSTLTHVLTHKEEVVPSMSKVTSV